MSEQFESKIHLRTGETADAISIIEVTVPARWDGPPLHHHDFDESFYVLEGVLTFQLGEELAEAVAGSVTFAPRGVHHTLANLSGERARYLLVCTPGGFERRFESGGNGEPDPQRPWLAVTVVGPTIPQRLAES